MMLPLLPDRSRPLLFAHRGCSSLAPENTMASFRKARETGAPGIELDIHAAASGELVVAHDGNFTRTAPGAFNCEGRIIEELNYSEIKTVDVGVFFGPGFKGEHPPLLEDVLESFCPEMYVDIELKTGKTRDDPLPGLLAALLKKFGSKVCGAVTVSSFNPVAVRNFKRLVPEIPTAVIYCPDKGVPFILRRGLGRFIAACDYLKPVHTLVNRFNRFRHTVLEGRPVVPWTIDDPAVAKKMAALGCAGIISNRPQDMNRG
jgi:glycerophosphoryl diester phosphodiesterase